MVITSLYASPVGKVAATGAAGLFIFWRHRAAGTDGQRTGNNRKFECLHLFILLQGFLRFFLFNLIAEQLNNEHIEQRNEEDTQERTCQHTA